MQFTSGNHILVTSLRKFISYLLAGGNLFDVSVFILILPHDFDLFPGSKLTAGIHKLADTLTKTTKKKSFDRQQTTSSPVEIQEEEYNRTSKPPLERKVSFDEKVKYIDRPASTENLLDGNEENVKEKQVTGVENEGVSDEGLAGDDYLQLVREPTDEEKQVELKVQQKIEALRKGEQVSF